jgi:hypothetical protein
MRYPVLHKWQRLVCEWVVKNLEWFTLIARSVLRVMAAPMFMPHDLQKLLLFPRPSPEGTPEHWILVWLAGWGFHAPGILHTSSRKA